MIKVGLVEDNETVRKTLCELIDGAPEYRCVCACATGKEALAEIPRQRPDIVLMDLHLPGESGVTLISALKERMRDLQFIVLTVYKDPELIFQALQAGACGYLLKRAAFEDVLAAIAEVRSGGAPMTSEIARLVVQSFQSPTPGADPASLLSRRELEILNLLCEGLSDKALAGRLGISAQTVHTHLKNVYFKLHVHGRAEAVAKHLKGGRRG
jgi:DNA-binding NarL/FixJ family response regulator